MLLSFWKSALLMSSNQPSQGAKMKLKMSGFTDVVYPSINQAANIIVSEALE